LREGASRGTETLRAHTHTHTHGHTYVQYIRAFSSHIHTPNTSHEFSIKCQITGQFIYLQ